MITAQAPATHSSQAQVRAGLHVVQASPQQTQVKQTVGQRALMPKQQFTFLNQAVCTGVSSNSGQYGQSLPVSNGNYVIMQQGVGSPATAQTVNVTSLSSQNVENCSIKSDAVESLPQSTQIGLPQGKHGINPQNMVQRPEKTPIAVNDAVKKLIYQPLSFSSNEPNRVQIVGASGQVSTFITQPKSSELQPCQKGNETEIKGNSKAKTTGSMQPKNVLMVPQQHGAIQRMVTGVTREMLQQLSSQTTQSNLNYNSDNKSNAMSQCQKPSQSRNVSTLLAQQTSLTEKTKSMETARNLVQTSNYINNTLRNKAQSSPTSASISGLNTPDIKIASVVSMKSVPQHNSPAVSNIVKVAANTEENPQLQLQNNPCAHPQQGKIEPATTPSSGVPKSVSAISVSGTPVRDTHSPLVSKPLKTQKTQARIVDYQVFLDLFNKGVKLDQIPSTPTHQQKNGMRYVMIYQSGNVIEAIRCGSHFSVLHESTLQQKLAGMWFSKLSYYTITILEFVC